jgi:hypothetical protein
MKVISSFTNSCSESERRLPVRNFQTPSTLPVTLKAQHDPQEPEIKICNFFGHGRLKILLKVLKFVSI